MNLVAYAGKWYKLASVWVLLGIGVISAAQPHLVDLGVSATAQGHVTAILSVLGVVARLIGQPNIEDSAEA